VIDSRNLLRAAAWVVAIVVAAGLGARFARAAEPILELKATVAGATDGPTLRIDLFRWSTDDERAKMLAALVPPPPPPPPPPPEPEPEPAAEGREGRGRGGRGRGGRGGRGGAPERPPAPPPTVNEQITAAVRAAPTVGFIWGDGPTGYSVRYAWRAETPGGGERIVLAIERQLGAHTSAWPDVPKAAPDAGYTVIEIRLGANGTGQAKASLSADVVDEGGRTLALAGYDAAPVLLDVTQ